VVNLEINKTLKHILTSLEQQLIRTLTCAILPEGTYLAGGTAVYFYLHHRLSVDLDFFTPNTFSSELLLHGMRECFDDVGVELLGKDTVILYLGPEKLQFSLFHFPYSLLSETYGMQIQEGVICPLASLIDIIAMKAVAINQRGSMKDFVDLCFMLRKTGTDFDRLSMLVTDKYGLNEGYDYQLKASFVYFDDAEKDIDQIIMLKGNAPTKMTRTEWENIKGFFREFAR
jgi:predicted nucleotidyltransferase component of viral defense system